MAPSPLTSCNHHHQHPSLELCSASQTEIPCLLNETSFSVFLKFHLHCIFFHYHLVPLHPLLPSNHHTIVHVRESVGFSNGRLWCSSDLGPEGKCPGQKSVGREVRSCYPEKVLSELIPQPSQGGLTTQMCPKGVSQLQQRKSHPLDLLLPGSPVL